MSVMLPGCLIFDLDGTLVDSLPGIEFSVRAAFSSCKLPPIHDSLRDWIGPPIRVILAQVGGVLEESVLTSLEQAFRKSYDAEGWRMTACYPDVRRILGIMLKEGYRLFIVSNKPLQISRRILEAEGILDLFEMIITRDSRSPEYSGKEEMIRSLMCDRGVSPDDCLFAGDTIEDAEAAKLTGIRFAFLTHGYGAIGSSASASIEYVLNDFQQFLPLMTKELVHD